MPKILLTLGVAAVVGVFVFLMWNGDDGPPGIGDAAPNEVEDGPGTPVAAPGARTDLGNGNPETTDPPPPEQIPIPEVPDEAPDPKLPGRITVVVRDISTQQPLPIFQCTWRQGGERRVHAGEDGHASWAIQVDEPGDLLVEAEDYQAVHRRPLLVPAATPELELPIFMQAMATLTGIELTVVDANLATVPHVRASVWQIENEQMPVTGNPVWERRASDPDGKYRLPPLGPGFYALRVQGVDDAGNLLPLLTHREKVRFSGNEHIPLSMTLSAGALLSLDVVDSRGQPLGDTVAIRTTHPDGEVRPLVWAAKADGTRFARTDGLPAAATTEVDEALPPGAYRFEFFIDDQLRHTEHVVLAAGSREQRRIAVR